MFPDGLGFLQIGTGHPRVSGDVSGRRTDRVLVFQSSPRERGCFYLTWDMETIYAVIPA